MNAPLALGAIAESREAVIAAEQALLGAVLQFGLDAWPAVEAAGLLPVHMATDEHAAILGAARAVVACGEAPEVVAVFEALGEAASQQRAGGLSYLHNLASVSTSPRYVAQHAAAVKRAARRRKLETLAIGLSRNPDDAELRGQLLAELQASDEDMVRGPAIPLVWARDMDATEPAAPQLVELLLQRRTLAMVYGQSGSGKTYFVGELGMAIAAGEEFMGRRTRQGVVIYIGGEGAAAIRHRVAAREKHTGRKVGSFALIPHALNMLQPSEDVARLVRLVRETEASEGERVALIVVDTVARAMAGGDENTAIDMGRLVDACGQLLQETEAAVLLVHHAGKDETRGARGHSSLRAATDTEIEVSADPATKIHTAKVTKQRDLGGLGERMAFKLMPVELGIDEWGNPLTACAVVAEECEQQGTGPRRLTAAQQAVLGYLTGHGSGIRRGALAQALEPQGVGRSSVYRSVNELLVCGMLVDVAGQVYLPRESA